MFLILFSTVERREGKEGAGGAAAPRPRRVPGGSMASPGERSQEPGLQSPKPRSSGREMNGSSPGLEPPRGRGARDRCDHGWNPARRPRPRHSPWLLRRRWHQLPGSDVAALGGASEAHFRRRPRPVVAQEPPGSNVLYSH